MHSTNFKLGLNVLHILVMALSFRRWGSFLTEFLIQKIKISSRIYLNKCQYNKRLQMDPFSCPFTVKTLSQKSSSLESVDRFQQNLACSLAEPSVDLDLEYTENAQAKFYGQTAFALAWEIIHYTGNSIFRLIA